MVCRLGNLCGRKLSFFLVGFCCFYVRRCGDKDELGV